MMLFPFAVRLRGAAVFCVATPLVRVLNFQLATASKPISLAMQGLVPFFREQVRLLGGFQVA